MSISLTETKDFEYVKDLLIQNDLPYEDIKADGKEFFLARDNSTIIGIVGIEIFDKVALLRSMTVKEEYRNSGYGKQICSEIIKYPKKQGVEDIYLLTTTAKIFFEKIGFEVVERNFAPDAIKTTTEFLGLCPISAVCLRMNLME